MPSFAYYNESIQAEGNLRIVIGSSDTMILKGDGTLWYLSAKSVKPTKIRSGIKNIFSNQSEDCYGVEGVPVFLVIKNDDTLWKIGYPIGSKDQKLLENVASAAPGVNHSLAVKKDGSVWAWGSNYYHQLTGEDDSSKPRKVKSMENAVSAYVHDGWYSAAIDKDGKLYAWGRATLDGENLYSYRTPRLYAEDVTNVYDRSYLKKDGSFWYGGEEVLKEVKYVSDGYGGNGLIKKDNTLWMFGGNERGELGTGKYGSSVKSPIKVMNDVKGVSTGNMHTAIVKLDGTLWTVGANFRGQLGTGKLQVCNQYTGELNYNYDGKPKKVMTNVEAAIAGTEHTIVLKKDGTLWLLGNGHVSPVKVMDKLLPTNKAK